MLLSRLGKSQAPPSLGAKKYICGCDEINKNIKINMCQFFKQEMYGINEHRQFFAKKT
jgi:hypothetical protein